MPSVAAIHRASWLLCIFLHVSGTGIFLIPFFTAPSSHSIMTEPVFSPTVDAKHAAQVLEGLDSIGIPHKQHMILTTVGRGSSVASAIFCC